MPKNVKNTTFPGLLDLIAPHSCRGCGHTGSILCDRCKNYILSHQAKICPNCKRTKTSPNCEHCLNLPPFYAIGERTDLIGDLVHDLKYHSTRAIAPCLADIIDKILPEFSEPVHIVPLPTTSHHIRSRGLDHTKIVAKHLTRLRSNFATTPALIRAKNTVQVGSSSALRKAQATSAYAINPSLTIQPDLHYLLLDDVWTTGASMLAATEKLRSAGAKHISAVILALSRID